MAKSKSKAAYAASVNTPRRANASGGCADAQDDALTAALDEITADTGISPAQARQALLAHFAPALRSLTASRMQGTPRHHAITLAMQIQQQGPIPPRAPISLAFRSDTPSALVASLLARVLKSP